MSIESHGRQSVTRAGQDEEEEEEPSFISSLMVMDGRKKSKARTGRNDEMAQEGGEVLFDTKLRRPVRGRL